MGIFVQPQKSVGNVHFVLNIKQIFQFVTFLIQTCLKPPI